MKAVKSARQNDQKWSDEAPKRGTKLTPNKKSGKERHHLYQSLENDDDQFDEIDNFETHQRESALDYFDDEE